MTKRKLDEYDPDALDGYGVPLHNNTPYDDKYTTMKQQDVESNHTEEQIRNMFNLLLKVLTLRGDGRGREANILIKERDDEWKTICKVMKCDISKRI